MGRGKRIPVNVYDFHSMVLGISAERFVGTAILAALSLIIFRISMPVSFMILLIGLGTAFYQRNGQYVLLSLAKKLLWKITRKHFPYQPQYDLELSNNLFIQENKRIGVVVRLLTDEIYDLGGKDAESTIKVLSKSLDSTVCDLNLFVLQSGDSDIRTGTQQLYFHRANDYASLKQLALSGTRTFDVYLSLSRSLMNVEADKGHLLKDLQTITFAITRSGYNVEERVSKEVIERICSTFL